MLQGKKVKFLKVLTSETMLILAIWQKLSRMEGLFSERGT